MREFELLSPIALTKIVGTDVVPIPKWSTLTTVCAFRLIALLAPVYGMYVLDKDGMSAPTNALNVGAPAEPLGAA